MRTDSFKTTRQSGSGYDKLMHPLAHLLAIAFISESSVDIFYPAMPRDDDISPQPHPPTLPNESQSEGGHRLLPPTIIELGPILVSSNANSLGSLVASLRTLSIAMTLIKLLHSNSRTAPFLFKDSQPIRITHCQLHTTKWRGP